MNRTVAHLIDNFIEVTLGSLRLIAASPQFHSEVWSRAETDPQDPFEFYAIPPAPPEVKFDSIHRWLDGRTHARFRFPSFYQSPHPENNIVHGMADLQSEGESSAALILLHGYQMNTFAPLKWFAETAARSGLDIYYLALPYHMQRAPRGSWSGQYGLSADIERTIQSFRQGVMDLRAMVTWVHKVQQKPVAIGGLSLGAFTSLMAGVVDDRPFGLVSLLGGASLANIIFAGFSFRLIRKELQEAGVYPDDLEKWWYMLSPGNFKPALPREAILLVGGEHDPIITPKNVRKLWQAWQKPRLVWYPCGHASVAFYARRIGERVADFLLNRLDATATSNRSATASPALFQPAQANTESLE
ncbi:MAG: hypothetical protein KatS3mg045_1770 [Bellilinea sp.]|nr:MAG: hypothetical protein KatS3mg045_1770 [Bellilinea sp.]